MFSTLVFYKPGGETTVSEAIQYLVPPPGLNVLRLFIQVNGSFNYIRTIIQVNEVEIRSHGHFISAYR